MKWDEFRRITISEIYENQNSVKYDKKLTDSLVLMKEFEFCASSHVLVWLFIQDGAGKPGERFWTDG